MLWNLQVQLYNENISGQQYTHVHDVKDPSKSILIQAMFLSVFQLGTSFGRFLSSQFTYIVAYHPAYHLDEYTRNLD